MDLTKTLANSIGPFAGNLNNKFLPGITHSTCVFK